jgi:hypothetical protein
MVELPDPVGWLRSPYCTLVANPFYKVTAPQSLEWSMPVFTETQVRQLVAEERQRIDDLTAERDAYRDSCEAKADRIDRLGESVQRLTAENAALRVEVERLKGLTPEIGPRPAHWNGPEHQHPAITRYGLRWNGPQQPVSVPMVDGYWTPAHAAMEALQTVEAERDALRAEVSWVAALLPCSYYMDPPDGGDVDTREQLHRMAKDAERYRWLRAEHARYYPICHLMWKRNGDRSSREWVNTAVLDTSIDLARAAATAPPPAAP